MKSFFLLLFFAPPLFAAAPPPPVMTLEVNPSVIGTNESAVVQLTVQGEDLPSPPEPSVSPAYTLEFSGRGQESRASFINGSVNVKSVYTYMFRLTPRKPGTYTIAGFKAATPSGTYYSPSAQIVIQDTGAVRAPVRQKVFNPFSSFAEDPGESFFSFVLSRPNPMQNTPFVADLYIFSQNPAFLDQLNTETDLRLIYRPNFDGGILHEMTDAPRTRVTRNFEGWDFAGLLFKRYIAYPLSADGAALRPPVYQVRNGLFEFYLQGEGLSIPVAPAPGGLGYVGKDLKAQLRLEGMPIQAGKDAFLTLTIEGDGNADYFADPFSTQKIDGLYISQPKTQVGVGFYQDDENRVFMSKSFSYTLSPGKEGAYTLPPIALSYVTPEGAPRSFTVPALSFEALPAALAAVAAALSPLPVPPGEYAYNSGFFFLYASWALGLILMLWAGSRASKNKRLQTDEVYARKQGARKRLHSALGEAEFALKAGKYREGARILRQSLMGYAADKLGLPPSSSPGDIAGALDGASSPIFLALTEELTAAAFGATPEASALTACLGRAQEVLDRIDGQKTH